MSTQRITPHSHHTDEGVRVTRRSALKQSIAAAAALSLGALRVSEARAASNNALAPASFFDDWQELTNQLFAGNEIDEELYLHDLNRLLARLQFDAVPPREKIVYEEDGLKTGPIWNGERVFAVELTMDPHSIVRPHNHPSHAGSSIGLEGHCIYEHYNMDAQTPPAQVESPAFQLQRTRRGVLSPGKITGLTRSTDNIHSFRTGPESVRMLDFLVTIGSSGRDFSVLEINESASKEFGDHFEARWVGNPYR